LAARLLEDTLTVARQGFASTVVLIELVRVLETGYRCGRIEIAGVVERLLNAGTIAVEHADAAWQALRAFRTSRDEFADGMIERADHANGCERPVTFDRVASRTAGLQLPEPVPR
jgi:predicted nucleic-acid-binding protein